MLPRLNDVQKAADLLRERSGEDFRARLTRASRLFWAAMFDADVWPRELHERADGIVRLILSRGKIDDTLRELDDPDLQVLADRIQEFARDMQRIERERQRRRRSGRDGPILIVDGNIDGCEALADVLGDLGHEAHLAHRPLDALSLVDAGDYTLALLDYALPGMNGVELYSRMKERLPAMEGLLLTAFAGPEVEREARGAGIRRVLAKPLEVPQLLAAIGDAGAFA